MDSHIVDGKFQSDKYPTCPAGKVPLSVDDPLAQDLLWEYAQRRRKIDAEFASDLEACLKHACGGSPPSKDAVFSDFKFEVGQIVRWKGRHWKGMVICRTLMQESYGTVRTYILRGDAGQGVTYQEIELEAIVDE